ncbi:competence protein TfoX [Paenibacillus timonensis]|nr:TfoX/Sxy family protein [Paenibacillus timonensis]MUG88657.1 competence protein TfoX [Paenibacillus timonensis]
MSTLKRQLQLQDLPNISTVIARNLRQAGLDTPDQLYTMGSKEAFVRIKLQDPTACLNMLYALEGAIRGIRWHLMDAEVKSELKAFFAKVNQ